MIPPAYNLPWLKEQFTHRCWHYNESTNTADWFYTNEPDHLLVRQTKANYYKDRCNQLIVKCGNNERTISVLQSAIKSALECNEQLGRILKDVLKITC